ncbi:hypothetical protein NQ318_002331 [Aromia moschata]|uniref:Uncharacterized protein n=1 Tax=Aromia moschata TaxID=1265417 RepID=A0AAV8Z5U3_9CUCU|nr:hypothetical protein NQ318_002331 [Aromia moschata]
MDNTDYYKSLISDEEVMRALIKESKARESEVLKEKTRLRPNLNFFQRTVTNIVSSNKRSISNQEDIHTRVITKHEAIIAKERSNRYFPKIKTPHTLMKEILLANKIEFVRSGESHTTLEVVKKSDDKCELKEVFTTTDLCETSVDVHHVNLDEFSDNASSSLNEDTSMKRRRSDSSSDISIISISSSESLPCSSTIIELSDTDSSEPRRNKIKNKKKFKHKKNKHKKKHKKEKGLH